METELMSWEAPIVRHHERSTQWYAVSGVIVLVGAVYGILSGAWTFTLVILLIGGVTYLLRGAKPPKKHVGITPTGIAVGENFTSFADLASFSLLQTPGHLELHFTRKTQGKPIVIQAGMQDPMSLRMVLSQLLPEEEKTENILDIIFRICKL